MIENHATKKENINRCNLTRRLENISWKQWEFLKTLPLSPKGVVYLCCQDRISKSMNLSSVMSLTPPSVPHDLFIVSKLSHFSVTWYNFVVLYDKRRNSYFAEKKPSVVSVTSGRNLISCLLPLKFREQNKIKTK